MNDKEYIESVEKLNSEYISLVRSTEYKKYTSGITVRRLLKDKQYSTLFDYYYDLLIKKFKKRLVRTKNEDINQNYLFYDNDELKDVVLKDIKDKKKVVYTCVLGDYDTVDDPLLLTENTDYIIYTDKDIRSDIWKVRDIPKDIYDKFNGDLTLINRYIKMHPFELFKDYDYALYVDGNIRVVSDMNPVFSKSDNMTGIGIHLHNHRYDLYDEGLYCIKRGKGNRKKIISLLKKIKEEGFPRYYGLCECCIFSVDLKNKIANKIMDDWWNSFYESGAMRDQLLFPYVLWKNEILVEELGILGTNVEVNPKFRKKPHINSL